MVVSLIICKCSQISHKNVEQYRFTIELMFICSVVNAKFSQAILGNRHIFHTTDYEDSNEMKIAMMIAGNNGRR